MWVRHFGTMVTACDGQGPVVRKPINANPQLKINRRLHFAYFKCFQELILT